MIDFKNSSFVKLKQTKPEAVMKDIEPLLINDELVIGAYKSIRDFVVFTNKRVISCNVQGLTGAKKDFTSLHLCKKLKIPE